MRIGALAGAAALVGTALAQALLPRLVLAEDTPPAPVQELSLDGLGVGSQAVFGSDGISEVYFPPPAAGLAGSGSFVRLFFAHSPNLGSGSGAVIAVNGQPLTTVQLTNGTAAGGVMEVRTPPSILTQQAPNRLEVRFMLHSAAQPPPAATDLYGRLDGQTMIHYQLAAPAGGRPAGLETYPFSLLGGLSADQTLGVVLPSSPNREELGTAFRLLADVGRRASPQRPIPRLVLSDQLRWLTSGGHPALIAGRVDRLPSPALLDAAGWRHTDRGWTGPGGQLLGSDDGLVATVTSPWDHRSPLLLVSGASDSGLARAAAALVGVSAVPLGGQSAVVSRSESEAARVPQSITLNLAAPRALAPSAAGRYRASMGFVAPPVDPEAGSLLQLRVPSLKGAPAAPTAVEAMLNGQRIGGAALDPAASQARQLRFSFPARLLRAGSNAMTLEFQLGAPRGQAPPEAGSAAADDILTGSLVLPAPASTAADLRSLPYPFFQGTGGRTTAVVATDGESTTLDGAALALLALGSRSAAPPPHLLAAIGRSVPAHDSDLIVVGAPSSGGELARLASSLPFKPTGSVGSVQELSGSSIASGRVLWIGGGPDTLHAAAAAVADGQLTGQAVSVDSAGHIRLVAVNSEPPGMAGGLSLSKALVVLGAALLLLTLLIQLARPRRLPA